MAIVGDQETPAARPSGLGDHTIAHTLDSALAEMRVRMTVLLARTQLMRRRVEQGDHLDSKAVVAALQDMEQQVWAMERALRASEERFRVIVEEAVDYALFTTDATGHIDGWYPGAEAVFGWTLLEVIGQPAAITFTPEDRETGVPEQELASARASGVAEDVRWHLHKDGHRVFIEGSAHGVRGQDGIFRGMFKIGQDVTARRAADEALRASEERFRALAEASAQVLYRMSPDWSEMRQLSGGGFLADTDRPRSDWREIYIHLDDREVVDTAITRAVQAKAVFELEHRVVRADGSIGWTLSRAVPMLDAGGELVEWFGAASDVSQRREAEAALRTSEASLATRVNQATAELRALSRRLLVVQEEERRHLARELHDEIGQVLTGLGFQLSAGADPDVARRIVEELTAQVRQMSMDLRPAALDAYGLLPALAWHIERYQTRTGIQVDLRHQGVNGRFPGPVEISAYRVVQEALTNVARHAGATLVSVQLLAGDGTLTLSIRDRGRGFNPDDRPMSSGLGGMRERVELLGGTTSIESAPGGGTSITVEIPLPELDPAEEEHP